MSIGRLVSFGSVTSGGDSFDRTKSSPRGLVVLLLVLLEVVVLLVVLVSEVLVGEVVVLLVVLSEVVSLVPSSSFVHDVDFSIGEVCKSIGWTAGATANNTVNLEK